MKRRLRYAPVTPPARPTSARRTRRDNQRPSWCHACCCAALVISSRYNDGRAEPPHPSTYEGAGRFFHVRGDSRQQNESGNQRRTTDPTRGADEVQKARLDSGHVPRDRQHRERRTDLVDARFQRQLAHRPRQRPTSHTDDRRSRRRLDERPGPRAMGSADRMGTAAAAAASVQDPKAAQHESVAVQRHNDSSADA